MADRKRKSNIFEIAGAGFESGWKAAKGTNTAAEPRPKEFRMDDYGIGETVLAASTATGAVVGTIDGVGGGRNWIGKGVTSLGVPELGEKLRDAVASAATGVSGLVLGDEKATGVPAPLPTPQRPTSDDKVR